VTRARTSAKARRAAPLSHEQRPREEPRGRAYPRPGKLILSAGALATAIASILALTGNVRSFFANAFFASAPEGKVKVMKIQDVVPMTFGDYIVEEHGKTRGLPSAQLHQRGQLVTYKVDTEGFAKNARLPVWLIVQDESSGRLTTIPENDIKVIHGTDCVCTDFAPTPHRGARYRIGVKIFPPGGTNASSAGADWIEAVGGA
jgi:hypothetical protein